MTAIPVTPIRYEWKPGSRIRVDAQIAGKELERIAVRDGDVVPLTIVQESREPQAPLHEHFEWDDTVAAESYREDEARKLIRSLVVVHVRNDTEDELPPVRALVRVTDAPLDLYEMTEPKHYTSIAKVMSNDDLRDRYVRQAFSTLSSWRDRYRDIEDFARIFTEIDALKEQYGR